MATYNGAVYLRDQLLSIAEQTRLPDELVVCDDASSDATLQLLNEFRAAAPFPVAVYSNKARLGPTKNFERAIRLCRGGIIVLCDQDDVWMPTKVHRLVESLETHPGATYAFSDAVVTDETLRPLDYTMWERVPFTGKHRRRFASGRQLEVLLKHNVVTGATMAFRAELREWILPIPDQWVHDAWIALLASAAGTGGALVEEPLISYRQHSKQVIGGRRLGLNERLNRALATSAESYGVEYARHRLARDRLASVGKLTEQAQILFEGKLAHLQTRQSLYQQSRWKRSGGVLGEVLRRRYHQFSNGWQSAVKDLLVAARGPN